MTTNQTGKLRQAIERFINTINLSEPLNRGIKNLSDKIEDWLMVPYRNMLSEVSKISPLFDALDPSKMGSASGKRPAVLLTLVGFCITVGISAGMALLQPVMKLLTYSVDKKVSSARFSPVDAVHAFRVGSMQKDVIYEWLAQLGWGKLEVDLWFKMLTHQFNAQEFMTMRRRDDIPEDEFRHRLKIIGFDDRDIALLDRVTTLIPGVMDLITMAVRDAWNDDAAARFGYDEDYPAEVGEWTAKQGLPAAWAKRYWRAHWQLPSPNQGFEMLHRLRSGVVNNPFTEQDLELLLRIADYPKFFRDKLASISYNTFTRVDVRRMYKLGILDKEGVKSAYLDAGYDEKRAEALTQFTVKYETGDGGASVDKYNDLTFSVIQQAYIKDVITLADFTDHLKGLKYSDAEIDVVVKLTEAKRLIDKVPDRFSTYQQEMENYISKAYMSRMISKPDATTNLSAIGFSQKAIDSLLDNAEYNYQNTRKARAINLIGNGYVNGSLDRGGAASELGKINIGGAEQDQIFSEWDLEKKNRTRRLTEPNYRKAMLQGLITEGEYREYLAGLGYTDRDIDLLVKLSEPQPEG